MNSVVNFTQHLKRTSSNSSQIIQKIEEVRGRSNSFCDSSFILKSEAKEFQGKKPTVQCLL